MIRKLAVFFAGEIEFEIEGGIYERFLNSCAINSATVKCIKHLPTGFSAKVSHRDYKYVKKYAKKYNCKLKIIKKTGLLFLLSPFKKRYGIVVGGIICVFLLWLSQNIIWDIRFYDCTDAQVAVLRTSLYEKGICEGSIVTKQLLEKSRNEIIIENSDFAWLTLNYIKGRLIVEKTDVTQKPAIFSKDITNIVATHDGIVRKIDVSGGFLVICDGQSVGKGDLLVSGIKTDVSGKEIEVHADAVIMADVEQTYEYTQPYKVLANVPSGKSKSYYEINFLNQNYKLYSKMKLPEKCAQKMYKYPLEIFGFKFPATVYEYEVRRTDTAETELSKKQATNLARAKVYEAINQDLQSVTITSKQENVEEFETEVKITLKIEANANIAKKVLIK